MEHPMSSDITVMTQLFHELKMIQNRQANGKLVIKLNRDSRDSWRIYFHLGRIVWATEDGHQVRRWLRVLKRYGPSLLTEEWLQKAALESMAERDHHEYWEVQILSQALKEEILLVNQVKGLIQEYIQEVFFSIIDLHKPQIEWVNLKELPQQFAWLDVDTVVARASELGQQWRVAISKHLPNLPSHFSPDFTPFILDVAQLQEKVPPNTFQSLIKILNGKNTFWDIAGILQQPLTSVVSSLMPLIQGELVELRAVPDLVLPKPKMLAVPPSTTPVQVSGNCKRLIACIDDSPTVCKALEGILKPHGYEVLSILDPLSGFKLLLEKRPELIFLDLMMPNTNGYEVCTFLRKSAVFRDIPIVMLTGQDGVIDRLRAKMVGSTEFLSKPAEETKVLHVVHKLLGDKLLGDAERVESPTFSSSRWQEQSTKQPA
jgi:two-component system, chemotaxis family, response regulator PixG